MSDLAARRASLTAAKRRLLEQRVDAYAWRHTRRRADSAPPSLEPSRLSYGQERLWFVHCLEPKSALYNCYEVLRVRGALDLDALERALDAVADRHNILRTRFLAVDGIPLAVADAPLLTVDRVDLGTLSPSARGEKMNRLIAEQIAAPFDLAVGPPMRVTAMVTSRSEHVLVFVLHHIVTDAWSMAILIRELTAIYRASENGKPSPLRPPAMQYRDYATAARDACVNRDALDYWRQRLAGISEDVSFPGEQSVRVSRSSTAGRVPLRIPAPLARELRAFSRREGVTLFVTLVAALQVLLRRYSQHDDIRIATHVSGRDQAGTEELIGFFINTVVLRCSVRGGESFRDIVMQAKATVAGALAHGDVPFDRVVTSLRAANPGADERRLFRVLCGLIPAVAAPALPGRQVDRLDVAPRLVETDLTWTFVDGEGALDGWLDYRVDVLDDDTAVRTAAHLETLLYGLVAAPDRPVSDVPIMPPSEARVLLEEWNGTATPFATDHRVDELFRAAAHEHPDRIAIVADGAQLTYAELNREADRWASRLRALGVCPEMRVGIALRRDLTMVAVVLGVLRAGGAYVPLDPSLPRARLGFMISDAHLRVVVTERCHVALVSSDTAALCLVDSPDDGNNSCQAAATDAGGSDTLAYVIYTSGSTGAPKGVEITHRSLVNFLQSMAREPGVTGDDIVVAVTTLSFDIAGLELLLPLICGARLVVASADEARDGARLWALMKRTGATVLQGTPATWRLLISSGWSGNPPVKALCGGEALPTELAGELLARCSSVWNMYGPTETTIWSTTTRVERTEPMMPIGRPIANTGVYVIDSALRPVPVGVQGELCIAGDGVARGYLGRPDLTALRFVPNPFGSRAGARLYRTGDVARWRIDGQLECFGRRDDQVKLRGFRVELGEVEAALRRLDGVRAAAASLVDRGVEDRRIVAYLVCATGVSLDAGASRARLAEMLPFYMMPSEFVTLEALPLTANGKLDRAALPVPAENVPNADVTSFDTIMQLRVAETWRAVLGRTSITPSQNFFEVGGHSLLATQLLSQVRDTLGVEVSLATFFERPTLAGLAAAIDAAPGADAVGDIEPRPLERRAEPARLSDQQRRLWFLDSIEPGNPFYNITGAIGVDGPLDISALGRALGCTIERHEALRTTFHAVDGDAVQQVHPQVVTPLRVIDLRAVSGAAQLRVLRRVLEEDGRQPFDLQAGPLFRLCLARLRPEQYVIGFTGHHIVLDGWSMNVFVADLLAFYRAERDGMAARLLPLPVQYADYAEWQAATATSGAAPTLAYWMERLHGVPNVLELPPDRSRPAMQTYRAAQIQLSLGEELSRDVRELARCETVTVYMSLMAAFQVVVAQRTGRTQFLIGTAAANRRRAATHGLIGLFANLMPLRASVPAKATFRELLQAVRVEVIGAYPHQNVPLERLVKELAPPRDLSRSPLVQIEFAMNEAPSMPSRAGDLAITLLPARLAALHGDFALTLVNATGDINGTAQYAEALYDSQTIDALIEDYRFVLVETTRDPETSIASLHAQLTARVRHRRSHDTAVRVQADRERLRQRRWPPRAPQGDDAVAVPPSTAGIDGLER